MLVIKKLISCVEKVDMECEMYCPVANDILMDDDVLRDFVEQIEIN